MVDALMGNVLMSKTQGYVCVSIIHPFTCAEALDYNITLYQNRIG